MFLSAFLWNVSILPVTTRHCYIFVFFAFFSIYVRRSLLSNALLMRMQNVIVSVLYKKAALMVLEENFEISASAILNTTISFHR